MKKIEIKTLQGNVSWNVPLKNLYILNRGATGKITINGHEEIDIADIDLLEDAQISKIEWNLDDLGNGVTLFVGQEYTKLRKMIVEVKTTGTPKHELIATGTILAGSNTTIDIIPPTGVIWTLKRLGVISTNTAWSGSSSDNMILKVYKTDLAYLYSKRDGTAPIQIIANVVRGGAVIDETPSTEQTQFSVLSGVQFTKDDPIHVYIENNNSVTGQSYSFKISIDVIEEEVIT